RIAQSFSRGTGKQKSCLSVLNGINQSAGGMRDGQTAIAFRIHLVEPTGFKARGHEIKIARGDGAARQSLIESDHDGSRTGKICRHVLRKLLQFGITFAQQEKLSARSYNRLHSRERKIDAFLMHET